MAAKVHVATFEESVRVRVPPSGAAPVIDRNGAWGGPRWMVTRRVRPANPNSSSYSPAAPMGGVSMKAAMPDGPVFAASGVKRNAAGAVPGSTRPVTSTSGSAIDPSCTETRMSLDPFGSKKTAAVFTAIETWFRRYVTTLNVAVAAPACAMSQHVMPALGAAVKAMVATPSASVVLVACEAALGKVPHTSFAQVTVSPTAGTPMELVNRAENTFDCPPCTLVFTGVTGCALAAAWPAVGRRAAPATSSAKRVLRPMRREL